MVMEYLRIKMVVNMKDTMLMINEKDKENINGKMESLMKVNGKMANNMVQANIFVKMENHRMENGKMEYAQIIFSKIKSSKKFIQKKYDYFLYCIYQVYYLIYDELIS